MKMYDHLRAAHLYYVCDMCSPFEIYSVRNIPSYMKFIVMHIISFYHNVSIDICCVNVYHPTHCISFQNWNDSICHKTSAVVAL